MEPEPQPNMSMNMKAAMTKSKRKRNYLDVKWLLLSGALVATLGLWGVFTRLEIQPTASAASAQPPQAPDPTAESSHTITLDLPPMPTLIPPAPVSASALAAVQPAEMLAAPTPVPVNLPVAPKAPVKIYLGGSKPSKIRGGGGGGASTAANSVPVTTTQSSR
jgi:hypothetical protein